MARSVAIVKPRLFLRVFTDATGIASFFSSTSVYAVGCQGVTINYGLNAIPNAHIVLPLGYDAQQTGDIDERKSQVGELREKFKSFKTRVDIVYSPSGEWNPSDYGRFYQTEGKGKWDSAGEQVIFSGFVSGTGFEQSPAGVAFTLDLTHWLSYLMFSSTLSNQSHPGNPLRFRWRAAYGTQNDTGTKAKTNFIVDKVYGPWFTPDKMAKDLWGECLHQMLYQLTTQDILDEISKDSCVPTEENKKNSFAATALARLETKHSDKTIESDDAQKGSSSPYWVPLAFEQQGAEGTLASAVLADVSADVVDSYAQMTMWDLIVGYLGPKFNFSVVPRVNTAMVVPFIPGLRTTFHEAFDNGIFINTADLTYLSTNNSIPKPIRGVGILLGEMSNRVDATDYKALETLGGCYVPDPAAPGVFIYKKPPTWLAKAPMHGNMSDNAFGRDASRLSSSTTPVTGRGDVGQNTPTAIVNKLENYYVAAAKSYYAQEMLRGRSGIAQSHLRFDIAPGTTISIGATKESDKNELLPISQYLIASVTAVSIVIDAAQGQAFTRFVLEHVRTYEENQDSRFSVDRHPFFSSIFTGAPLVDDYAFKSN